MIGHPGYAVRITIAVIITFVGLAAPLAHNHGAEQEPTPYLSYTAERPSHGDACPACHYFNSVNQNIWNAPTQPGAPDQTFSDIPHEPADAIIIRPKVLPLIRSPPVPLS